MMTPHFNDLTPAETERLALIAEECAEVIQAVSKIMRHGYGSRNPLLGSQAPSNRQALETEVGHVLHAIDRLVSAHDLTAGAIDAAAQAKADRIGRWLHHQDEEPRLHHQDEEPRS